MGSPSGYKDIGALLKALDQHRQDVNSYSTKRVKVGAKVATSPRVSLEFPFLSDDTICFEEVTDIIEVCKIVISKLKILSAPFDNMLTTEIDLSLIEQSVYDREIIISFYGDSNVGKSTVVNSILGDVYLPMAGNTETAVSVAMKFIGPKDGYEGTPSKECMLRIEGTDYEDLHPKKLCLILTEVNKDSRKKGAKEVFTCNCELIFSSYLMGVVSTQNVILQDNPGLDEFGSKVIKHTLSVAKKKSSAYVIITTFEDYKKDSLSKLLLELYHQDQGIIRDDRLTFVINKIDLSLRRKRDEENFTKDDIIKRFKEYMSEVVFECSIKDIKDKSVILLCGSWALQSKMFINNESRSLNDEECVYELTDDLLKTLTYSYSKKREIRSEKSVSQQAEMLKEYSNIEGLEGRLVELTKNAKSFWKRKNVIHLEKFMSELKNEVEFSINSNKARSAGPYSLVPLNWAKLMKIISRDYEHVQKFERIYGEVVNNNRRNVSNNDAIVLVLKFKYEMDMKENNLEKSLLKDLNNTIVAFKSKANEKISSSEGYSRKCFVSDLKQALRELSGRMRVHCNCMNNLKKRTEEYMDSFYEKISKLRRYFGEKDPTTKTSKHQIKVRVIPPILKSNITLPIEWTMFERASMFMRWVFHMSLEYYQLQSTTIASDNERSSNNDSEEARKYTQWTADLDSELEKTEENFKEQIHSTLAQSGVVVMAVVRDIYKTQLDCLKDFEKNEGKSINNALETFKQVLEENEMTEQKVIVLGKYKNYIEEMMKKFPSVSKKELPLISSV